MEVVKAFEECFFSTEELDDLGDVVGYELHHYVSVHVRGLIEADSQTCTPMHYFQRFHLDYL